MFSRLWNVISVGVGLWSITKTLKTISENKNEMFEEFYGTLSPEEKKAWKKIFGVPPVAEIAEYKLPQIPVVKIPEYSQVEKVEAGV